MQEFKDNGGRNWTLAIDINAVKRCRNVAKVDLLALDQGEPPLSIRIELDPVLLCDVLWAILGPDAAGMTPPVTDEQFGTAMGGGAIKRGKDALWAELTDFFRQLGRLDLAQVLTSQKAYLTLALDRKSKQLAALDLGLLLDKSLESMNTQSPSPSLPAGSESTNLPESSGLTPADSHSARLSECATASAATNGIELPT